MILRSVIAALAGFILLVGVITTPLTPVPFSYLALGYSLSAAAIAAFVFFIISIIILDVPTALASTFLFALPAVWLSQRALLSRRTEDPDAPAEFYPIERLLLWILGLGGAFTVLIFGVASDFPGGLPALLGAQLLALIAEVPEISADLPPLTEQSRMSLVALVLALTPSSWMLSLATSLLLGQKLAEKFDINRRPSLDLSHWLLPPALDFIVLLLIGACFVTQGAWQVFFAALTICVVTPYFLLGLSAIHAIAKPMRGRSWILAAVYFVLLSFLWAAIPVIILGLLESRWSLRTKIENQNNTQKENDDRS